MTEKEKIAYNGGIAAATILMLKEAGLVNDSAKRCFAFEISQKLKKLRMK